MAVCVETLYLMDTHSLIHHKEPDPKVYSETLTENALGISRVLCISPYCETDNPWPSIFLIETNTFVAMSKNVYCTSYHHKHTSQ